MTKSPEAMLGTPGLRKSEGLTQHLEAKGIDHILLPEEQGYKESMRL